MEKVYRVYVADRVSVDGFGELYKPLEARQKALGDEIPRLQGEIDFLKIQHLSSEDVVSEAQDLYSRWPHLEFSEKRKVVENITERITIGKNEVAIDFCYLPSFSEDVAKGSRGNMGSSPRPDGSGTGA
jgi:site-specific DNA recombinase